MIKDIINVTRKNEKENDELIQKFLENVPAEE